MEKTKKRKRRSDSKVITKEAQVLRFMRKSKNLSMRSVDYKEDLINFIHKMDDAQIMKAFNFLKAMIK